MTAVYSSKNIFSCRKQFQWHQHQAAGSAIPITEMLAVGHVAQQLQPPKTHASLVQLSAIQIQEVLCVCTGSQHHTDTRTFEISSNNLSNQAAWFCKHSEHQHNECNYVLLEDRIQVMSYETMLTSN